MKKKECKKVKKEENAQLTEEWASQQRNLSYAMQDEANEYFAQNLARNQSSDSDLSFEEDDQNEQEQSIKKIENVNQKITTSPKNKLSEYDFMSKHRTASLDSQIQSIHRKFSKEIEEEKQNNNILKDEEDLQGSDIEERNTIQDVRSINIPGFKSSLFTKNRTRNRSYEDKGQSRGYDYFSLSREEQLKSRLFTKERDMKDIQNESFQTSYHITEKSFKWSTQLKYPSVTQKKGAMQNYYQNQLQNLAQKEKIVKITNDINSRNTNYFTNSLLQSQNIKNASTIFQSVEFYCSNLSFLLDKFKKQQQKQNFFVDQLQFQYYSKLDQGSFGQVDLYFFEVQEDYPISIQQENQLIFDKSDQPALNNNTNQYSSFLSSQNSSQSNSIQMNSTNSNQIVSGTSFSKGMSQESTQMNSQENQKAKHQNQIKMTNNNNNNVAKQDQRNNFNINIQNTLNQKKNILPVAGKKIKIQNEFIRELYIMQKVESEFMPKLLSQDIDQQILFIELGLCSLFDLKMDSQQKNYLISDDLTYAILINLFQAIESLLSNYNYKEQKSQSLFHSDIKPQNIILTVKKSIKNETQVQLLLIDFGGASFQLDDYWSYFTPAFVCNDLWEKLVNSKQQKGILTWEEVRYAEVYAACRSVQFLIIDQQKQYLFKKQNSQEFLNKYKRDYPKTCRILEQVFLRTQNCKIFSNYENILSAEEISKSNQITPQRIYFDEEKLFQMSKFYNIINSS